jgi:hypothetical protein
MEQSEMQRLREKVGITRPVNSGSLNRRSAHLTVDSTQEALASRRQLLWTNDY